MNPVMLNRAASSLLLAALAFGSYFALSSHAHRPASLPQNTERALPAIEESAGEPFPDVPPKPAPLSNRIVEYHMAVELNAADMTLAGSQNITWKNPGTKPVNELYFHLYPNAFESKRTTFMRESGGKLRNDRMKEGSFGGMRVLSVKTAEGFDLTDRMSFVSPDDGNKDDRTLMKLSLPAPVAPGGQITLLTKFTVKLPAAFARMGYVGDYVMAGQWFPKLAVYEPKGRRGREEEGWNLHQYHGNSEFYADFGIYDVKIRVPADYTVAATGFPIKPPAVDGATKQYHFYAEDVHDFAWAASPNFLYYEEPFSAPDVPGVKIKLYLDPAHEPLKHRYMLAAKKALSRYSQWYGAYPYSTLSIVVPPKGGNGTGGMEYPTLITAWAAEKATPDLELERVVVHEIGHQYWYGMVASNEFEEAWLDEGFTSYAENKVMSEEYGIKPNPAVEAGSVTRPAALNLNAWDYATHGHYADNVYTKAKLVLAAIEKKIGEDAMKRVLRTYFQRWKFRHPGTADFQAVLEEVTRSDWSDFFRQFVYGDAMTDYSVERIASRKKVDRGKTMYESTVVVQKRGGTDGPVPIRFRFADGSTVDKLWDGRDALVQFRMVNASPLQWVAVDPNYSLVLENNHINNFIRADIDKTWKIRLNLSLTKLIETLLNGVAW